jgi:hypothetical protein
MADGRTAAGGAAVFSDVVVSALIQLRRHGRPIISGKNEKFAKKVASVT